MIRVFMMRLLWVMVWMVSPSILSASCYETFAEPVASHSDGYVSIGMYSHISGLSTPKNVRTTRLYAGYFSGCDGGACVQSAVAEPPTIAKTIDLGPGTQDLVTSSLSLSAPIYFEGSQAYRNVLLGNFSSVTFRKPTILRVNGTFDTGAYSTLFVQADTIIYAKRFSLGVFSSIIISPGAHLKIYLTDRFSGGSFGTILASDPSAALIYAKDVYLGDFSTYKAYIYAQNRFGLGGYSYLYGASLAKGTTIGIFTTITYKAPTQELCSLIQFEDVSVLEGAGSAVVSYDIFDAAPPSGVEISTHTVDGTAVAPDDYASTTAQVVIPQGQSRASLSIPIVADTIPEGMETFKVRIDSATNAAIPNNPDLTVSILDNDSEIAECVNTFSSPLNVNQTGGRLTFGNVIYVYNLPRFLLYSPGFSDGAFTSCFNPEGIAGQCLWTGVEAPKMSFAVPPSNHSDGAFTKGNFSFANLYRVGIKNYTDFRVGAYSYINIVGDTTLYVDNFSIETFSTLNISRGNVIIYAQNMNLNAYTNIHVNPGASLHIYTGNFTASDFSNIIAKPQSVAIFSKNDIRFGGYSLLNGFFYAENRLSTSIFTTLNGSFNGANVSIASYNTIVAQDAQKINDVCTPPPPPVTPPKICYTLDLYSNATQLRPPSFVDHKNSAADLNKSVSSSEDISVAVHIWDYRGEQPLQNAKLGIFHADRSAKLQNGYGSLQGEFSSANSVSLAATDYTSDSDQYSAYIALGAGRSADSGGTIQGGESYRAKFHFNANGNVESTLQLYLDGTVMQDGKERFVSAELEPCSRFEPVYADLNIERTNNQNEDAPGRYAWYTQIAKRSIRYRLVAYEQNSTQEKPIRDLVAKVYLYDLANDQKISADHYFRFPITGASSLLSNSNDGIDESIADTNVTVTQDAIFRIEVPQVEGNIVARGCEEGQSTAACFQAALDEGATIKTIDARDDFAIRPAGYYYEINIANNAPITNNNSQVAGSSFAAGLGYRVAAKALPLDGTQDDATIAGYTTSLQGVLQNGLDSAVCNDTSDLPINFGFVGGEANATLSIDRTGIYSLHIGDSSWTAVDQNGTRRDCIVNSALISNDSDSLSGCDISSRVTLVNQSYFDTNLTFVPHHFRVDIAKATNPSGMEAVYMNDINQSRRMSAQTDVNVTAQSANDVQLTNFTDGCMAQRLNFSVDLRTNPQDITALLDEAASRQRMLLSQDDGTPVALDANITTGYSIAASKFESSKLGRAEISLNYNITRSPIAPMDPIFATLGRISVVSPDIPYALAPGSTVVPDGNTTTTVRHTLLYARARATQKLYEGFMDAGSVTTQLAIDVYCSDLTGTTCLDGMGQPRYGGRTSESSKGWWMATNYPNTNGAATLNLVNTNNVNGVTISPSSVTIPGMSGSNALSDTIAVSCPTNEEQIVDIALGSSSSLWLIYDNVPLYRVKCSNGSEWAGLGRESTVLGGASAAASFDPNNTSPGNIPDSSGIRKTHRMSW